MQPEISPLTKHKDIPRVENHNFYSIPTCYFPFSKKILANAEEEDETRNKKGKNNVL